MSTYYKSLNLSQPQRSRVGRNVICCAGVAAALLLAQTASPRAAVGTNAAVPSPVQLDVIAQDLAQSAAEANSAPKTTSPAAQDPNGKTAPADSANKEDAGKNATNKDAATPASTTAATAKTLPASTTAAKDAGKSATPKAAVPRAARLAPADAANQRTVRRETATATQQLLYWRSVYRERHRNANYDVARTRRDGTPDWWGRHFVLILGVGY